MSRFKWPDVWLLVALAALTVGGAVALNRVESVDPETRRLSYHRHYWQTVFDSLSAACGVGLLAYDFQQDYTPAGRWILTAIGVAGAWLFLAATTHAARRMQGGEGAVRVPHPLMAVIGFAAIQIVAVGIYLLANKLNDLPNHALGGLAAFASLGWAVRPLHDTTGGGADAWPLTLLAWIAAIGWPVWLLVVPGWFRRFGLHRTDAGPAPTLALLGGYVSILLLAALAVCVFERPNSPLGRGGPNETLSGQPPAQRYWRSLVQVTAASGAGIPTEKLTERNVSEGTKIVLAAVLLTGGLAGSPTGGMQFPLLMWALAGGLAGAFRFGGERQAPDVQRWMHAGMAVFILIVLMTVFVAGGLLLLEQWTASAYQTRSSFADAMLDASSVVAGGALSGGLAETLTSRNLISGLNQPVNLYPYGMSWLMLAMLIGRVLPVAVLRRLGETRKKYIMANC